MGSDEEERARRHGETIGRMLAEIESIKHDLEEKAASMRGRIARLEGGWIALGVGAAYLWAKGQGLVP